MDNVFQRLNKNIEEKDTGLISEILKAFDRNGKYTFRSIKGISKELNYPESTVGIMFKAFEDNGLIKKVRKKDDGQFLWGITSLGKFMKTYKK